MHHDRRNQTQKKSLLLHTLRIETLEKRYLLTSAPLYFDADLLSSGLDVDQSGLQYDSSVARPLASTDLTRSSGPAPKFFPQLPVLNQPLLDLPTLNVLHSGEHPNAPGCCCPGCAASVMWDSFQAEESGGSSGSTTAGTTSPTTPAPLSETFKLHSNPGAKHTIYLDFDGHTTSGTIWNSFYAGGNSINSPAFNFEGTSSTFTNNELSRIQWIWARVAEDFLPFNVNVTTQDPGVAALSKTTNDTEWGVRVVIGGSSSDWYGAAVGGVAFVGSFNMNNDTPVFVFPAQLGNGHEKYVAGVVSHEVGHALGLNHHGRTSPAEEYYSGHGSGDTGWAPIMGSPHHRALTTWSRGEYANANNSAQDDLQIITTQNGFGYRTDDHGNTQLTATLLTSVNDTLSAQGVIETRNDVDVFSFTADAGQLEVSANPAWRDGNLDILLELLDSSFTVIASSNPSDFLSASITQTIVAGNYFLRVSGVGKGNPSTDGYSDYGSLGQYRITTTLPEKSEAPDFVSILSVDADKPMDVLATSTSFVFVIQREGENLGHTSTVKYVVAGHGDHPASPTRFLGAKFPSGTITFEPGQTSYTLIVEVVPDGLIHPDEGFTVTLTDPVEPTVVNVATAVGIIRNNFASQFQSSLTKTGDSFHGVSGQQRIFRLTMNDSTEVSLQATYDIFVNWGDGSAEQQYSGTNGSNLSYSYSQPGQYEISVRVTRQGRVSNQTLDVNILASELQGSVMMFGGTGNDDQFTVTRLPSGKIRVERVGDSAVEFTATTGGVRVFGAGGSDTIVVNGTANADTFTITSDSIRVNQLLVTGTNIAHWQANGLEGNDTFRYLSGSALLDGGAGSNLLIGPDTANQWWIDGVNAGSIHNSRFSNIGRLRGGTADDQFVVTHGGSIDSIDGRIGYDRLSYIGWNSSVNVALSNRSASGVGLFNNVELLEGQADQSNTIRGANSNTTWRIDGDRTGTVGSLRFQAFDTLVGGSALDRFYMMNSEARIGQIDGGVGLDALYAAAIDNVWEIEGSSAGVLNNHTQFSGIVSLRGGAGRDWFRVAPGATFSGSFLGGTGLDTLDYSAWSDSVFINLATGKATGVSGTVSSFEILIGGSGDDTLTAGGVASVLVGGAGNDLLTGGSRNDILIGGIGNNRLRGGLGSDLLIGGSTLFDSNALALADLLAEWSSSRTYLQRIDNLRGVGTGVRLNGTTVLGSDPRDSIFADASSVNELLGGSSVDWLIASLTDLMPDRVLSGASAERVDLLSGLSS